jgi:hypothetical protein
MPDINSTDDDKTAEAITKANQDLNDQGDIAADDAGGTAAAHRVEEALEEKAPD